MRKLSIAIFLAGLCIPTTTFAATPVTGYLLSDTTWTKAESPYVVTGTFIIPYGMTLTIEHGTIVKLNDAWVDIYGMLLVGTGTSSERTYFTSIKDDTVGGDTNNDGTSTVPAPADWKTLYFRDGSQGDFHFTTLSYSGGHDGGAGYSAMVNDHAVIALANSAFNHLGRFGMYQSRGTTTLQRSQIMGGEAGIVNVNPDATIVVHQSSIYSNSSCGFCNDAPSTIDLTNNWWGTPEGPYNIPHNASGTSNYVVDALDVTQFIPWLTAAPDLDATTSDGVVTPTTCVLNCHSSVLFLPGLEASRLYRPTRTGETGTEKQLWEPTSDSNVEDLFLDTNGKQPNPFLNTSQIYTKDVVDEAYPGLSLGTGAVSPNIYKSFLAQLSIMKNVDHTISDYAAVPYDWRLSLQDVLAGGTKTGDHISYLTTSSDPYILSELRRLVAGSDNGKVTIIAHSNGGLVAKLLLKQLQDTNDPLLAHIDKLILVASPQVGTPEALGALLFGFNQGIPSFAHIFLSESTARTFAENSPGAYNLLPSTAYFDLVHDSAHPLITFDNSPELSAYRSLYGQAVGNSTELRGLLLGNEGRLKPQRENLLEPNVLNSTLIQNTIVTHAAIDSWTPTSTIKVIEIAGWGNDTLAGLKFWMEPNLNGFGTTFRYTPDMVEDGDGTVVVPSALAMSSSSNVTRYWVDLRKYNGDGFAGLNNVNRNHKDILEVKNLLDFLQDTVINASTTNLLKYKYISTSTPQSPSELRRLHYFLHSPLSLDLYDGQGHHTGISTTTSNIESLIPDSYYRQIGEVKYISAPASTTLHLVMKGQATGIFTLKIDEVQGDNTTASTTFLSIPASTSTLATFDTPAFGGIASSSALHIDENGDGVIDFNLAPKLGAVVMLPVTIPDITPPTTTVSTIGTLGNNGWYTSNVSVTLTATDIESGVASTTYSLNSGSSWAVYTAPLTLSQEGSTTILFRSTDQAGNKEATNTLMFKIDKTAPEARMVFDPITQTLKIIGSDNLSSTTVATSATSTIITDQAGHTLQILFTQAKPKTRRINLVVTKLLYDGAPTTASTSLKYKWNTNTDSTYKLFAAHIASSTVLIESHFRPRKNQTILMTTPVDMDESDTDDAVDARPIKTTVLGMIVEGLTTNKGKINVSY